ncbi:MAG: TldD/PmbA family protein [Leptospirales bacterium]|jgi:TldD protein
MSLSSPPAETRALAERLNRLCETQDAPDTFAELRYHKRRTRSIGIRKGEVSDMSSRAFEGIGIRVLIQGSWGFAATSDLSQAGLERALGQARSMARLFAGRKSEPARLAPSDRLARGDFAVPGFAELQNMPIQEKFELVRKSEEDLRGRSRLIDAAICSYTEVFEEKYIVTTDGARCGLRLVRPELRFAAFANQDGKSSRGSDSVGVTGGWECLFQNRSAEDFIETAAKNAVDLLSAPAADGGKKRVILSPAMVGLLSHEAIGHTVEADFVNSGSVAAGKLGTMIASPLITLCDSGQSEYQGGAGGILPVDDEGVLTQRTAIIEKGELVSYLHNRETAAQHGVEPTGNARAWEFNDEPLIRMRNTYIEPGQDKLEDMIAGIDDGYFVDGPEGGQADATGEFMFGASRVRRIRNGKLGETVQKLTVSGNAFDVLKSVDAVSTDFRWDLGSGHCGKGQPAKVDAGGPYLRCEILAGGAQN